MSTRGSASRLTRALLQRQRAHPLLLHSLHRHCLRSLDFLIFSFVHLRKLRCLPLRLTMSSSNVETRTLFDELKSLEKGWFFDFGHPLVNRVAESFVKGAGIGAIQAVSREAYFTVVEGAGIDSSSTVPELPTSKRHRFPGLRGENSKKSLEEMVKSAGKESFQWGLAAGVYSGLTYGLREARGSNDWKNSAVAGAITGAALAMTGEDTTHEQIVQCAITGAAISTAANLLTGIF